MKTQPSIETVFIISMLIIIVMHAGCKKDICEDCVDNQPPIAHAGNDQTIILPTDSVYLNADSSIALNGVITAYEWTKISGPDSITIVNPTAVQTWMTDLKEGNYYIELKVTDSLGMFAKDTVQVTVLPAQQTTTNHPPVANAGNDTTIIVPGNTVNLNGSLSFDTDNNITGYLWTKISGPSSFNITNANVVQTPVINLVQGDYLFELKVTDADALFDRDTIQVTVMAVNPPPACTNCEIVFVSDRDGNAEIYSCDADGSNISRLTNNAGIDDQPAWSPDGLHIAFVSDRTGSPELYIMDADGNNVVRKTFSESYSQNPTWSPDGTRIAYSALSNGSTNIWVVGATSGSPTLLFEADGKDIHPSWSPDGTKIALVTDWYAYDFVYDIFTINTDGTHFTDLTGGIFDHIDYLHPSWSPSGTKLAVAIISNWWNANESNTQVGVMNANGFGVTAITSGAAPRTRTSWAADGTRILYTSLSGSRKDISWVSADGSASGTLVTNGWNADWQH